MTYLAVSLARESAESSGRLEMYNGAVMPFTASADEG